MVRVRLPDLNVSTAFRDAFTGFGSAAHVTIMPFSPDDGEMVTHGALDVAVQADGLDVTRVVVVSPAEAAYQRLRDVMMVGGGAPSCLTVKVLLTLPAVNVTTPDRADRFGFGTTSMEATAPVSPWLGDTTSQLAFEVAVHDGRDVTLVTVMAVPYDGSQLVRDNDSIGAPVPSWRTVTVAVAVPAVNFTAPDREDTPELATTVKRTADWPVPDVGLAVSQAASDWAVQLGWLVVKLMVRALGP
jgi:hypothetical protein